MPRIITGLGSAIAKETFLRDVAFLPVEETVCGIRTPPMTFFHWNILAVARSPMLGGRGMPSRLDALNVLWVCSRSYKPESTLRRCLFFLRFRKIETLPLLVSVREWVDETLQDIEDHQGVHSTSYYSSMAAIINCLAGEYHWTEQQIIHLPIKRGAQYIRAIMRSRNAKAPMFNPSDRVKGRWLNQRAANRN